MKRLLIPFAILALAFVAETEPGMKIFRKEFPLVKISAADTIHFYPYEFRRGTFDSAYARFFYERLLRVDTAEYTYLPEYNSSESFFRPILRGKMNGVEIYVGEFGDTNHLSIYLGKDVMLFTYSKKTGFSKPFVLADEHAGEGPWFQKDSWFTDLNHDGKVDILSREVGQYMQREDENGVDTWDLVLVDDLYARTLVDTGFVKLELSNPDSLRNIYHVHH